MASLYANENFPLPVVEALRALGHQVVTVQETCKGDRATSDEEVLAFAVENELTLLTLNRRHFIRLHNSKPGHSGIIVCSFDTDFDGLARRIHSLMEQNLPLSGKLIRVNRPST